MYRRIRIWAGLLSAAMIALGAAGCAHQRESFTWPWKKKAGSVAMAEPPLDQAAREAPRTSTSPSTASRSSSSSSSARSSKTDQARAVEGDAFEYDAFRD